MVSTFVYIMMINKLFIMCENLFDNIVPSTGSECYAAINEPCPQLESFCRLLGFILEP
jgi:hypothetical protein